ncbi:histone-lysine N-methyltransferase SETD5-like isoform X4 [Pangasianodon hypophthalmus]|uniref:histone-lysine N-methyltransferase SETD5-like isoform X4 n=1 Tax=Pangasianodon hypophthalmus TaxID=310915 RepID=UPI002307F1BB|nr:histone-lysine N-methyltransferase SETD5-like isoform X4 [Pangasianodon hypophthalmus]
MEPSRPVYRLCEMKLRRRRRDNPKQEAEYFTSAAKDKEGFDVKYINSFIGRGVFSCVHFDKGDFLLEYRGQLINKAECERRQKLYHDAMKAFMYEFRFNGRLLCVDASREDGSLGRLVNDDHISPNSKMKIITEEGKPHLCLFATRSIDPGEEITYDYGNSELPWRNKIVAEEHQLPPEENSTMALSEARRVKDNQSLSQHQAVSEADPFTPVTEDTQAAINQTEQNIAGAVTEVTSELTSVMDKLETDVLGGETEKNIAGAVTEVTSELTSVMDKLETDVPGGETEKNTAGTITEVTTVLTTIKDKMEPEVPRKETEKNCKHEMVFTTVSSMNKCAACVGPVASLKWIGLRCKVCNCFWHKSCFVKLIKNESLSWVSAFIIHYINFSHLQVQFLVIVCFLVLESKYW